MQTKQKSPLWTLSIGALGIVYGDIGTSVLYAFREVFMSGHLKPSEANILGILSLFFWALTVIVSIKYIALIMRADNNGEGGLMALLALASMSTKNVSRMRPILIFMGVFGVALFFGDGVITPAMTVLSAVEGLAAVKPSLHPWVLPIALIVLFGLFFVQRRGTHDIGKFFGPIMILWFITIGVAGAYHIAHHPVVLLAFSPLYAFSFLYHHAGLSFITLGAVFLCLTGAEALYADMGHFGKTPIRLAWFVLVMPALVLNYFGQGALVLARPDALRDPFFNLVPTWLQLPLVFLATAAAIIASQALITGAFSAVRQTIQLGFLPRLTILHTSITDLGQIYVPVVNWCLAVGVFVTVILFQSSSAMAAAYGISVSLLMGITTLMTFFVVRYRWNYSLFLSVFATLIFFLIDATFVASNSLKIHEGGWFPLMMACGLFIVMSTWSRGQHLLHERRVANSLDLQSFLETVFANPPVRVDGTAIYLASDIHIVPNAMLHNLKHNKVLHQINLFVTVRNHEVPWVSMDKRLEVESLGHDCWQITVHYGFKNEPDLPFALELISGRGFELDPMATSYFLSRDSVLPTHIKDMAFWRKKLFAQMYRNASSVADFLKLPSNAVIEMGTKVEI